MQPAKKSCNWDFAAAAAVAVVVGGGEQDFPLPLVVEPVVDFDTVAAAAVADEFLLFSAGRISLPL